MMNGNFIKSRACKFSFYVVVAVSLILCSCDKMETRGLDMNPEDRINEGYKVASTYVRSNYEWDVDEYFIKYRFVYDDCLVYDVTYRDDIYDEKLGGGKSISVLLNPETLEVVQVLKSQ